MNASRGPVPPDEREHFLALVAHELRSPLNGIKSWAHVLERYVHDHGGDETAEKAVAGIMLGVEQQVALIEEFVDGARILCGVAELSQQPMRLEAALADAIASTSSAASGKHVQVVNGSPAEGVVVNGDFARLQQLLVRLLDNAIRFSPPGSRVQVDGGCDRRNAWIAVGDEGPAISSAALTQIFEPFGPVDASRGRRAHLLGLGLAVSRRIAELHGGTLDCASGAQHGATFRLTLPLLQRTAA